MSQIDKEAVIKAYERWAPIYDKTFGAIANAGRKQAVNFINKRSGRVLEVGVGTGLSLPHYKDHLSITGIDLSTHMLEQARNKVQDKQLENIDEIIEMDASNLEFDDNSFDVVVAMYVMTVVPEPEKVLSELTRVCKNGGDVIIVNHFSSDHGIRGFIEKHLSPLADKIGWRPVFPIQRVMRQNGLRLTNLSSLWPLGLFTLLRFTKDEKYRHPVFIDENEESLKSFGAIKQAVSESVSK